ncbi:hypothetical protein [Alloprevotella tannerae]|uniref:hypothetical protein n=1 Tax=Alloprevotella tannerae TaxID=76122 RepID=UPI0028E4B45D|nr:hypothetical protein [Alloprevotella tannerae]
MKQKENEKRTYVTPQMEFIELGQNSQLLQQFSGDNNDADNDDSPLNAPRPDGFPDDEDEWG